MLAEADKTAKEAKAKVEWVYANATRFKSTKKFDGAICLCEGAFSLLSSGDKPIKYELAILQHIYSALKPGAKLILNALNGYKKARRFAQNDIEEGKFDPITMTEIFTTDWDTSEGKKSVQVREHGCMPMELTMLLEQVGFNVNHIWGGTASKWGPRPIDLDEIELMVIARKPDKSNQ
jgi:hypothetical protein